MATNPIGDDPWYSGNYKSRQKRSMFSSVGGTFHSIKLFMMGWNSEIHQPIDTKEVGALIRYASENGINPKAKSKPDLPAEDIYIVPELYRLLSEFEYKLAQYENQENIKLASLDPEELASTASERVSIYELNALKSKMLQYYSELNKYTTVGEEDIKQGFRVNGRTLIETRYSGGTFRLLISITLLLLFMAIANEILASWAEEAVLTDDGWDRLIYNFRHFVMTNLIPFVWGGLGACIYIMMTLYDIAQHRAFDQARLHGWFLRVVLGSILGAVVVSLFSPESFATGEIPLETKSVAFLVGLGVKVVYGGLLKMVNILVEKFNLDSLSAGSAKQAKLQLNEQITRLLADPDITKDEGKKSALIDLLQKIQSK